MLDSVTAPKTSKPRGAKAQAPKVEPVKLPTLAEIGREAQRTALRATLNANGWNLSATAKELGLSNASNVIRTIRTLGMAEEYEKAKADGLIQPGRHGDAE